MTSITLLFLVILSAVFSVSSAIDDQPTTYRPSTISTSPMPVTQSSTRIINETPLSGQVTSRFATNTEATHSFEVTSMLDTPDSAKTMFKKPSSLFDTSSKPHTSDVDSVRWAPAEFHPEKNHESHNQPLEDKQVFTSFSEDIRRNFKEPVAADDKVWQDRKYDIPSRASANQIAQTSIKPPLAEEPKSRFPFIEVVIEETYPEIDGTYVIPSSHHHQGHHHQQTPDEDAISATSGEEDAAVDGHNLKYLILSALRDGQMSGENDQNEFDHEVALINLLFDRGKNKHGQGAPSQSSDTSSEMTLTKGRPHQEHQKQKPTQAPNKPVSQHQPSWKLVKSTLKTNQYLKSNAQKWLKAPLPKRPPIVHRLPQKTLTPPAFMPSPAATFLNPRKRPPSPNRFHQQQQRQQQQRTAVKSGPKFSPFLDAWERKKRRKGEDYGDYYYEDNVDEPENGEDEYYYDYDEGLLTEDKQTTKDFVKVLKDDGGKTVESQQYYPSPFLVSPESKSKNKIAFYSVPDGVEADEAAVKNLYESDPILRDPGSFVSDHGIWTDEQAEGEVIKFVHYSDKKGEDDRRGRPGGRLSQFFSSLFSG